MPEEQIAFKLVGGKDQERLSKRLWRLRNTTTEQFNKRCDRADSLKCPTARVSALKRLADDVALMEKYVWFTNSNKG